MGDFHLFGPLMDAWMQKFNDKEKVQKIVGKYVKHDQDIFVLGKKKLVLRWDNIVGN